MSIASQQRVIEEHQATIKDLKARLRQAEADRSDGLDVFARLTEVCDDHEVGGAKAVPVTVLRGIRPKGHGL